MENEFAKIFEVENYQVLIMKDETNSEYEVKQIIDFKEVRPIISLGFDSEEKRDDCFNNYDKENAKKFYNLIFNMLKPE
ncbi:MAG: hypothetical protein WC428_02650 [Candidatus Paceibacterota bacterium]